MYKEEYGWKEKSADDETRKYSDKLRDVCALAERLGCSFGQLAIAWSLKNESVQCLLLGASNIDQLYESLQSLQLIPKLNANIMNEIERILDNKPSRPPMISTLALRWQSICPHGSGGGSLEDGGSPKSEGANSQDQEQTKELTGKLPFCEIQWNKMLDIFTYIQT